MLLMFKYLRHISPEPGSAETIQNKSHVLLSVFRLKDVKKLLFHYGRLFIFQSKSPQEFTKIRSH